MNNAAFPQERPNSLFDLRQVIPYFWRVSRIMTITVFVMAVAALIGMGGLMMDDRIVTGLPNWAKTTKFAISIFIYSITMLWIFSFDTLRPRLSRFVLAASGLAMIVEIGLIMTQAVRGRMMHFNLSTSLDAALFGIMGSTILILWFVNALGVGVLAAQRVPSRAFAWSLRLGLIVALIGMLEGYLMTNPTPEQMAAMQAGLPGAGQIIGAHTVGAPDGGPGLPFLGWSTTHGDLRIGHFVGLHGLQVIPLLGLFLMLRPEAWLSERHKLLLVWTGALGYLGLVGITTWQALRGQPFIAPDALTIGAFAALLALTSGAALAILLHARRTGSRSPMWSVPEPLGHHLVDGVPGGALLGRAGEESGGEAGATPS